MEWSHPFGSIGGEDAQDAREIVEIDSNAFCYCGAKKNGVDVDVAMEALHGEKVTLEITSWV